MQPLDISVYGNLKQCFEQAICIFQRNHASRIENQYDVPKLFASAYLRVAIPQNAISGFQSSGIWPYNPNVFADADYAPHSVTDRPYPNFTPASLADLPDPKILQSYADKVSLSKTETPLSNDSLAQCKQLEPGSSTRNSPQDVRPCPTAEQSDQSGRKRESQRAEILTITPVKNVQREKLDKKERKSV
jgi:hypothetical protein